MQLFTSLASRPEVLLERETVVFIVGCDMQLGMATLDYFPVWRKINWRFSM